MNHGMAPGLFGMLWSSGHVRAGVCSCYGLDGSQTYKAFGTGLHSVSRFSAQPRGSSAAKG